MSEKKPEQRVVVPHALRSVPHLKRNRRTAYYTMGGLVLGLSLVILFYVNHKGGKNIHSNVQSNVQNKIMTPGAADKVETLKLQAASPHLATVSSPLSSEFNDVKFLGFQERIDYWSAYLEKNKEGRQKLLSLAHGHQVNDLTPIVPNEYNSITFIETVAALARSETPDYFFNNLLAIRYSGGKSDFFSHNHLLEADWIPNNQKAEIIRDITRQVAQKGGLKVRIEKKQVNRAQWLKSQIKQHRIARNLSSLAHANKIWSKPVQAKVPYIEISHIQKVMKEIPDGAVLSLVHRSTGTHPVLITHQGIVIRQGDRVLLRRASLDGHIRTNELNSYLQGLLKQQGRHAKWPLIGINLNQLNAS